MEATVMDDTSHCFLMSLQCQHVYPAAAVTSKTVMQAWHQWLLLVCVCVCERSWQPGTHANSSFSLHIVIRRLVVNPGPDAYYSSDVITSRQIAVLFVCVYFFTLTHTQMCRCCTVMTPAANLTHSYFIMSLHTQLNNSKTDDDLLIRRGRNGAHLNWFGGNKGYMRKRKPHLRWQK